MRSPESLNSTLWESINDLNSYQTNFDRIVASIFGHRDKPPIGEPPSYIKESVIEIPNLTKTDNFIFKRSCEVVIKNGDRLLNPGIVFFEDDKLLVPENELKESLDILEHHGFIEIHRTLGGWGPFKITLHGFNEYLKTYVDNYDEIIEKVIISIVNEGVNDNFTLQEKLNQPISIINHVLDLLENNSHIKQVKVLGGGCRIHHVAPTLKRMLS